MNTKFSEIISVTVVTSSIFACMCQNVLINSNAYSSEYVSLPEKKAYSVIYGWIDKQDLNEPKKKKYTEEDVTILSKLLYGEANERDIEIQQERYERLRTKLMSYGVSGMSDMPRDQFFVTDKVAETIAKAVDIENSLKTAISNQKKEREALESIIVNLKSSNERAVIRTRYFDSMSWQEVSKLLFGMEEDFDDRQESYEKRVFKIHGSALLNMAIYQYNEQHYYDTHPDGF